MRLFILFLFAFPSLVMSGQNRDAASGNTPFDKVQSKRMGDGQVTIRQSQGIEQLMTHYIQTNRANPGVEGYRIQLYSGSGAQSKQEAENVRARVLGLFPNEKVDVEYNAPLWRVKIAYFRHRHEALPLLSRLKSGLPSINSYVVRDPAIRLTDFK